MDEFPQIHWRTERNVGLEQKSPRLTILDILVLIACSAAGMGIARLIAPYNYAPGVRMDAKAMFVEAVVPCLFGALNIGHPVLWLLHRLMGRRRAPLSVGEICGLVATGCFSLFFLGEALAPSRGDRLIPLLLLTTFVAIVAVGIVAACFLVRRLIAQERVYWTDVLGSAAAIFTGGLLLYAVVDTVY